jgi:hypothetical protein
MACALVLASASGCGNSDGDGNGQLAYPDIPGLVVFYKFDGDLSNAVADIHHGIEGGTVEYVADHRGTANSAVSVDGDTIRVADHADLDITGAITIAAWVKPEVSNHAFAAVVDKDYLSAYSFGVHGGVGPDTVRVIAFILDQLFESDEVVPFATGTWSHIAFTYDEAVGEGKFYVNGAFAGSTAHDVAIGASDAELRIGVSTYGDTYSGAIDQLAIFERALTAPEVHSLYAFE